jgi:hypothetical protein
MVIMCYFTQSTDATRRIQFRIKIKHDSSDISEILEKNMERKLLCSCDLHVQKYF